MLLNFMKISNHSTIDIFLGLILIELLIIIFITRLHFHEHPLKIIKLFLICWWGLNVNNKTDITVSEMKILFKCYSLTLHFGIWLLIKWTAMMYSKFTSTSFYEYSVKFSIASLPWNPHYHKSYSFCFCQLVYFACIHCLFPLFPARSSFTIFFYSKEKISNKEPLDIITSFNGM